MFMDISIHLHKHKQRERQRERDTSRFEFVSFFLLYIILYHLADEVIPKTKMNSTRKTKRRNYKHTAHSECDTDADGRYDYDTNDNNKKTMSLFTRQVDKKTWKWKQNELNWFRPQCTHTHICHSIDFNLIPSNKPFESANEWICWLTECCLSHTHSRTLTHALWSNLSVAEAVCCCSVAWSSYRNT